MFLLAYVLGLLTLPFLLLVFAIFISPLHASGYRSYVLYEHVVNEQGDSHDHAIKAIYPKFIRNLLYKRSLKTCLYGKLKQTPPGVWDDEIGYIIETEVSQAPHAQSLTQNWDKAEEIFFARYRDTEAGRKLSQKNYAEDGFLDLVAEAQLARKAH